MSALKCIRCDKADLFVSVGFDGLDKDSEAGEGSGYNWTVDLNCPHCGGVYTVGRVKKSSDFALDTSLCHFAREGQEVHPMEVRSLRLSEKVGTEICR